MHAECTSVQNGPVHPSRFRAPSFGPWLWIVENPFMHAHGAPRGSLVALCAEACRAIKVDLGAISPGRAAAGDGCGGLAEGEQAF